MITGLRVDTNHKNSRVMHAIKERRDDQYQYLVELTPNKSSLNRSSDNNGKAILNSAGLNNPNLVSYPFELKRGLYDVTVARIAEIQGSSIKIDPDTKEKYPDPIMVGEKYVVQAKIENADCYGVPGVRVRIRSMEMELDSSTVYYKIKKENLENIKYYVPFNQSDKIEFFIKDVQMDEIDIYLGNPSFQIEKL